MTAPRPALFAALLMLSGAAAAQPTASSPTPGPTNPTGPTLETPAPPAPGQPPSVLSPPMGVDPQIQAPVPVPDPNTTPVIRPPGTRPETEGSPRLR